MTGVDVVVGDVQLKIRKASGQVSGVTIGNPDGYESANAFDMDLLRLNLGLVASLGGSPLVLDELVIDSPIVNLEFNQEGGTNLEDLSLRIQENQESADEKSAELEPADPEVPGEPFRIAIRKLRVEGVTMSVRRADGTKRSGTLPPIELNEVGGEKGVTPGELGVSVILAIVNEALRQAVAHRLVDGDLFDSERTLSVLAQKLSLSGVQRLKLEPVVDGLCQALNNAVETWVARGFVEADAFREDLAPVFREAKELSEDLLDPEQAKQLDRMIDDLKEGGVDVVRTAMAENLAGLLGLSGDQMAQAGPVLKQHMIRVGELIAQVSRDSDPSRENFKSGYRDIQQETRRDLESILGPGQMQDLIQRQDRLREEILNTFGAGE